MKSIVYNYIQLYCSLHAIIEASVAYMLQWVVQNKSTRANFPRLLVNGTV